MTLYNMTDTFVNKLLRDNPRGKVYTPREIALCILHGTPVHLPSKKQCPAGLRRRVLAAFKCCEYCGVPFYGFMTVDRVVPRVRGGRYTPDNVTATCGMCNSYKGASDFIGPVRTLQVMEARNGGARS